MKGNDVARNYHIQTTLELLGWLKILNGKENGKPVGLLASYTPSNPLSKGRKVLTAASSNTRETE